MNAHRLYDDALEAYEENDPAKIVITVNFLKKILAKKSWATYGRTEFDVKADLREGQSMLPSQCRSIPNRYQPKSTGPKG